MTRAACIKTKPSDIRFSIDFSDNSERLSLGLNALQTDVLIKQGSDRVLVAVDDIDWLIQALADLKEISYMPNRITGSQVGATTIADSSNKLK